MSCIDGFRLPAASECSLRSKARIDALFEDSRSVCSSSFAGWCPSQTAVGPVNNPEDNDGCCADEDQQRRVNSAVQARIEAMFASVEAESAQPGECAAAVLPVKYMGAAPVGGRVASVRGLQEPLRQLVERIGESVNAELEVSRRGLTFRTSELHEKNNPFRRIAVWSALKLQTKRRHGASTISNQDLLHAFVPLVADERGPPSTTSNLADRHADLYRTMRGFASDAQEYPPIFAVVMRRPGAARLLECHAFACRCEEDAIAAAATLYRALLADLDATSRRPRQKNGLGCVSLASIVSSARETSPGSRRRSEVFTGSRPSLVVERLAMTKPPSPPTVHRPVRPPRVKKNSASSNTNTEDELSSSTPCTNVSVTEKAPVHHKKNSDIKAEDVLEARSRRLCSPNRELSKTSESSSTTVRHDENSSSSSSSILEQTSEERRMNAKNKIYGTHGTLNQTASSDEVQVIYDERKSSLPSRVETVEVYRDNNPEKSSLRNRSSSCEFDCCTENSLYESSRIYAKARMAASKPQSKSEQRIYEVSRPPDRSTTPSHRSTTGSARRESIYATRPTVPPPDRPDEPMSYVDHRRRSIASSIGNRSGSTADRRREHFRNVDKIYSLGSEEIYSRNVREPRSEERIYDVMRPSRPGASSIRNGDLSDHSARSTRTRLSRVSTLDRPLRRPATSTSNLDLSQQSSRHHHQPPPPPQEPARATRRRSRAGSEPPSSRTEAAAASAAASAQLMRRTQSDLDLDRGDLLTRVELPRRGSFLKPGSVRKRDGLEGGGGGTPLGFSELFDEFRNQEGLTSVDDILAAIIDPEGMSFNDLKPLYKEFLLKLAATLTQDELYQRSASIMRRRRRPQRRRSSRNLLRRAIKRSVSRLRSGASSAPTEFTSVIFPARRLNDRSSYGSSSSCDVMKSSAGSSGGHHHRGSGNRVLASKLGRRRSMTRCSSSKSRIGQTTSEDSDTCRRIGRGMIAANRSSSGYVSCSECSYDSESCTCVSADKCYCSLSRKTPTAQDQPAQPVMHCSCDTDSCSESNKCYCARKPAQLQQQQQPSILEQLRQKGIVPSESTLSRGASPDRSKRAGKGLASTKSLEYLKVRSSSIRGSADNLALDYDLFSPGRRSSQCSSSSEKVLVVSARDPQGRLIYVGGTQRESSRTGKRSSRHCQAGKHRNASDGHHEALSIKKSAEIAAVFGGGARIGRRASSTSSLRSSVSLEAGLGYLP